MSAAAIAARAIPRTARDHAVGVDAAELEALLDVLRGLEPDDWDRPTDCDRWTVRQMVAHVVGASEEITRPWISLRRIAVGTRRHPQLSRLDRLNEAQVEDRADRSGPELTDELAALATRRVRARQRMPGAIRRLPVIPGFDLPPGTRLAYLLDVITIRDVWMHRVDICVATGRQVAAGDHDGEIVRQVIADLARSWPGPPVELELTGPAGGRWLVGDGAPVARAQAETIDYMRCLAGRNDRPAITVDGTASAGDRLVAARVAF